LNAALDIIFNHPNVAPFICVRLIQHLVTSNPSPQYVARVSSVFNNNGQNIRGDLKAVVKAILLDAEARSGTPSASFGHLREPVLFTTSLLRTLNARTTDYDFFVYYLYRLGQFVFYQPTVFNYYPPNYKLRGTELYAPELAIQTTQAALSRINLVHFIVFGWLENTTIDYSSLQSVAGNSAQLVERVNQLLLHGTMSPALRDIVTRAVNVVSADNTLLRAQTAIYLVASSSQYQIKR